MDLVVFREPQAADPRAALPAGLVRDVHVVELRHHAKNAAARTVRNGVRLLRRVPPLVDRFGGFEAQVAAATKGKRYRIAVAEHFWCAPYIDQLAAVSERTVLDLHNVESVLHAGCAATEPRFAALGHRHFLTACLALETALFPRYSQILTASAEDARRVREISPGANVSVYANALPWCPVPTRPREFAIAFSGNLEYHPNRTAVRFFAREIWPGLRQRWPGLVWRLIGKNPDAVKRYTQNEARIEFTGPIPDAVSELAAASVVVAPLLTGSGTRLKILEAWAAARPVVSTRIGAEGLPASHGENILLADTAAEFAEAVSELLGNPEMRERLGRAARLEFERYFTWEAAWSALEL